MPRGCPNCWIITNIDKYFCYNLECVNYLPLFYSSGTSAAGHTPIPPPPPPHRGRGVTPEPPPLTGELAHRRNMHILRQPSSQYSHPPVPPPHRGRGVTPVPPPLTGELAHRRNMHILRQPSSQYSHPPVPPPTHPAETRELTGTKRQRPYDHVAIQHMPKRRRTGSDTAFQSPPEWDPEQELHCPKCQEFPFFSIKTQEYLDHMKNIHNVRAGNVVCPRCNKTFGRIKLHFYTHTKEKPFICDRCGKAFTQSFNLKRHEIRPHKHPCGRCTLRFVQPSDLKKHVCSGPRQSRIVQAVPLPAAVLPPPSGMPHHHPAGLHQSPPAPLPTQARPHQPYQEPPSPVMLPMPGRGREQHRGAPGYHLPPVQLPPAPAPPANFEPFDLLTLNQARDSIGLPPLPRMPENLEEYFM